MEEFRIMRRIALLAALNCAAFHSYADDALPAENKTASAAQSSDSPFRSLLARGWESKSSNRLSDTANNIAAPSAVTADPAPSASVRSTDAAPPIQLPIATAKQVLAEQAPALNPWPSEPGVTALSLADLIRGQESGSVDSTSVTNNRQQQAPTFGNTTAQDAVVQDTADSLLVPAESRSFIDTTETLNATEQLATIARDELSAPEQSLVAKEDNQIEETTAVSDAEVAPLTIGQHVAQSEPQPITTGETVVLPQTKPTAGPVSVLADSEPAESDLANVAVVEPAGSAVSPVAKPDASTTTAAVVDSSEQESHSVMPQRSRRVADQDGFGMLALDRLENEYNAVLEPVHYGTSMTTTIHATRLHELARESLNLAHHRLQRRATHSAKKFAIDALRSVVVMQDSKDGGNRHATQLEVAMNAVRESKDFCGRFGAIDHDALVRLVAVHETDILKDRELDEISSLRATEMYLAVAQANLVAAADSVREASDALVLLGRIEKQMSPQSDTHATAVAVTLQRAAVEIDPGNGSALRELGRTLSGQGLLQQAVWALGRSVELEPTRGGYESLLDVARKLGNVDLARGCLAALNDEQIPDDFPVFKMAPDRFAATYRPNHSEVIQTDARGDSTAAAGDNSADSPSDSDTTRVSKSKSWFSFGRR